MTANTIAADRHESPRADHQQRTLPDSTRHGPTRQLNRVAAEILSDATHRPLELLERFDTQQQGE